MDKKIAIDVRELGDRPAGRGRFIRSLLAAMTALRPAQSFVLFGDERSKPVLGPQHEQVNIAGPSWRWHWDVTRQLKHRDDILTFIATRSPIVPSLAGGKTIFVVYDLVFKKYGKYLNLKSRLIDLLFFRTALSQSRRILTISQATADDIAVYYPGLQGKLSVIPMAADAIFVPRTTSPGSFKKWGINGAYILIVGTIEPRKNHANLVAAYQQLPPALQSKYALVVVGKKGWMYEGLVRQIKSKVMGDLVVFIEYVSDAELAGLYNGAALFVYPSLYEGFGLPVLEAMSCGLPVITSNVSSLPEAAGGNALLVDPRRPRDIAVAIERVLGDARLAARLKHDSIVWSSRFSWKQTAQRVYRDIDSYF